MSGAGRAIPEHFRAKLRPRVLGGVRVVSDQQGRHRQLLVRSTSESESGQEYSEEITALALTQWKQHG